jgi:hypothetical protein
MMHGTSMGALNCKNTASFGGFIELNGEILGMSVCHGTCPKGCTYVSYRGQNGQELVSNGNWDYDYLTELYQTRIAGAREEVERAIDTESKTYFADIGNRSVLAADEHATLTVEDRKLGFVCACSGYSLYGYDWSIFSIVEGRKGKIDTRFTDCHC